MALPIAAGIFPQGGDFADPLLPAPAYPITGNVPSCPYDEHLDWGLPGGSPFTSNEATAIDTGMGDWASIRDLDGVTFLTETRRFPNGSGQLPAGTIRVIRTLGTYGYADCPNLEMEFDPSLYSNLNEMRNVVAHEAGHYHGFSHSGSVDNPGSTAPTMSTCRNFDVGPGTQRDDDAQAHFRAYGAIMNAVAGFELVPAYYHWNISAAGAWTNSTAQGAQAMIVNPGGRVEQNFIAQNPGAGSRTVRMDLAFKMGGGANQGLNYKAFRTGRNYPTDTGNCGFSGNQNFNAPSIGSEVQILNQTTGTWTSWAGASSPLATFSGWEGYEYRISVVNGSNVNGFADNVFLWRIA